MKLAQFSPPLLLLDSNESLVYFDVLAANSGAFLFENNLYYCYLKASVNSSSQTWEFSLFQYIDIIDELKTDRRQKFLLLRRIEIIDMNLVPNGNQRFKDG